ncbi:uncharacterized protein LOC116840333 [Odontomachus brunneus]|uniref:uncharacterized protein LOC116840333 n=1 Tax=Odontomachus brunneus TaxID=486640 RepID=UPI0013F24D75|nr:uncharacterized protein LOC116840333 [Odontomachus brunneus]
MSSETADKQKCESVTEVQSVPSSSLSLECTIKPSDEFLHVYKLSYTFSTNKSTLSNKEIKTIETKMDKLYNKVTNSKNATLNDIIILAYCYQNLCHGHIKSNRKGELRIGKTYILRCLNLVKGKELDPKSILIALKGHFQLGYIYFTQKKSEKALQTCNKAIELYLTYTDDKEKYGNPINFENIIMKPSVDNYYLLNIIYKEILELIVVPDINLSYNNMVTYSHLLLTAELNMLQESREYLLWIKSALKISNYLILHDRFVEARSHIITAIYVKKKYFHEILGNTKEQIFSSEERKLSELYLELDMLFSISRIKYGIKLLHKSVERLLRLEKGEEFEIDNLNLGHPTELEGDISQKLLLFNDIDTEIAFTHTNPFLPVKYILHYNDAYKIFTNILRNVSIARCFLDKSRDLETYGQLILDTCEAYKYMSLYEKDIINRNLLRNGIVDLLSEDVKNQLLKTRVPAVYCSTIQLQLAITLSNVINVKLENTATINRMYMPKKYGDIELEIRWLVRIALIHLKMMCF